MKKTILIVLSICLVFSMTSIAYAAETLGCRDTKKVVIIGYDEDQRESLFDEKSDKEINKELDTIINELLAADNVEDILEQKYKETKLFIKIIFPQENREICLQQSYDIDDGIVRGSDENPISRTFNYRVGFELNAGIGYGYYQTVAGGSYNSTTHIGVIDSLHTTHTAGLYFSYNDSAPGTNTATTTFTCFVITYSVVVVIFTVTSSGTITIS